MAKDMRLGNAAANAQADVLAELAADGFIDLLTGSRADDPDAPLGGDQVRLSSLRFGSPAFMPAKNGVLLANPITAGEAVARGDPTHFRAYAKDHVTLLFDGTAGTSNADFLLKSRTIVEGAMVECGGLTYTVRKTAALFANG